jgi:hypothetical protein
MSMTSGSAAGVPAAIVWTKLYRGSAQTYSDANLWLMVVDANNIACPKVPVVAQILLPWQLNTYFVRSQTHETLSDPYLLTDLVTDSNGIVSFDDTVPGGYSLFMGDIGDVTLQALLRNNPAIHQETTFPVLQSVGA